MKKNIRSTARLACLSAAALMVFTSGLAANSNAERQQAKLDAACESAREAKLAPLRRQYIDECVEKKQKPDRAACERFYADYGSQSGNRAPLFYDLPECEKAFEYRKQHRTR